MIPTNDGPMKPGDVEIQFERPMMIPAYFGAISRGLTMNPVNEKPKNATAIHKNDTVISDRSGNPERIINNADPAIPKENNKKHEVNKEQVNVNTFEN